MKITYDPEADALYIWIHDAQAHDSVDIEEGITADLDEDGHMIGLEILDASERLTPEELTSIHYENLLYDKSLDEPAEPATSKAAKSRRRTKRHSAPVI